MIANNASGTRTVLYGSTRDYVMRLVVALASGELIELGTRASKSSSGYSLINLFVGSEGTLGIVIEATMRLVGFPAEYSAAVATSFPSVAAAARTGLRAQALGTQPCGPRAPRAGVHRIDEPGGETRTGRGADPVP